MSLASKNTLALKRLSLPVSYRVLDENKLYDAQNIFDNKGVTETRYGIDLYNSTSLGGKVLSMSYFKTAAGVRYKIVKIGTVIYSVAASGAHTSLKTGLSATTKHRGVTTNGRHVIAIESDGLYSFNGTTFTQLGQAPPTAGTATASTGGSLAVATFKIGLTFYSSATGFETNVYESGSATTSGSDLQISVSAIPATAANGTMDKVRIYLKNVTSNTSYLFCSEQNLGITTATVSATPTSTQIPPTTNAAPITGGGKYLTSFGKAIAYTGNSTYLSDVFISEDYLPDAFDGTTSQVILHIDGQGPVTGIATGLYDNNYTNPYLAIFKKNSVTIYSELGGVPAMVQLDPFVGCISHDTIKIRNGNIYFMSTNGWYIIQNGALVRDNVGKPVSMGGGDIDDIFSRVGWNYELNAAQFSNFFSVIYPVLGHYMTFIAEGANEAIYKAYNYEEKIGGFRPQVFKTQIVCGCEGEDDNGYECVFLADQTGAVFTYSVRNSRHDEDYLGASQSIPAFGLLPYVNPGDIMRSYNFRTLAIRAISSSDPITVRAYPSFELSSPDSFSYDFPSSDLGFTLDVSQLDVGVLGNERVPVTIFADINRTAETMMIGFYQDTIDANLGLISAQLEFNKNGNRNT